MRVSQAITRTRVIVGDEGGETWTTARVQSALDVAIEAAIEVANKVAESWFHDAINITSSLVAIAGNDVYTKMWKVPERVKSVINFFTDSDLTIPLRKAAGKRGGVGYYTDAWKRWPGAIDAIAFPGGYDTLYALVQARVPGLLTGACGTPGASTFIIAGTQVGERADWEDSYRGYEFWLQAETTQWVRVQITAYNASTKTITFDESITPGIDDAFEMALPFGGRLDHELCTIAAHKLLIWEGHRRQANELLMEKEAAMGKVKEVAADREPSAERMVEEVW